MKQGLGQRGAGGSVSSAHKPYRHSLTGAPLTPLSHPPSRSFRPPIGLSLCPPDRHSRSSYAVPGLALGTQLSPKLPQSHHATGQQDSGQPPWRGRSDPHRAVEVPGPQRGAGLCLKGLGPHHPGCRGWDRS